MNDSFRSDSTQATPSIISASIFVHPSVLWHSLRLCKYGVTSALVSEATESTDSALNIFGNQMSALIDFVAVATVRIQMERKEML
jgi:hypothetical protein